MAPCKVLTHPLLCRYSEPPFSNPSPGILIYTLHYIFPTWHPRLFPSFSLALSFNFLVLI